LVPKRLEAVLLESAGAAPNNGLVVFDAAGVPPRLKIDPWDAGAAEVEEASDGFAPNRGGVGAAVAGLAPKILLLGAADAVVLGAAGVVLPALPKLKPPKGFAALSVVLF
jgi:hypothetical protein